MFGRLMDEIIALAEQEESMAANNKAVPAFA